MAEFGSYKKKPIYRFLLQKACKQLFCCAGQIWKSDPNILNFLMPWESLVQPRLAVCTGSHWRVSSLCSVASPRTKPWKLCPRASGVDPSQGGVWVAEELRGSSVTRVLLRMLRMDSDPHRGHSFPLQP